MPARFLFATLFILLSVTSQLSKAEDSSLPNTKPLTIDQPLDEVMVDGINKFALRETKASVGRRAANWKRDYGSHAAHAKSVSGNRQRFLTIIGAVDQRVASSGIELLATLEQDSIVASGNGIDVHAVRWKVLDGITAEGLLLQPSGKPVARVIALPDADWTPEMFVGLAPGADGSAVPRRLAENGAQVLIPMLISRDDTLSGSPYVRYTNQTHREFIYRMAFEMGRHVIGYEVQKVLAAVDLFSQMNKADGADLPIGVCGVGEGGLLALYSGAADQRIDAVMVSGYFQQREGVWEEPIYRNVWALLTEFGDAELASLIAPRPLVIEACAVPESDGPPAPKKGRSAGAAPGRIETATLASVRIEYDRAMVHYDKLKAPDKLTFVSSGEGNGSSGTEAASAAFWNGLGVASQLKPANTAVIEVARTVDTKQRQKRQFNELVVFTQTLLRRSAKVRDRLWAKADRSSLEKWDQTTGQLRDHVYDEMIGRLPKSTMPLNVRSRKVLDEPAFEGYEVVMDVYPDVIASGILLLPRGMKEGEKRPVVVCQHGLEGVPMDTITTTGNGFRYYKAFAAELAKRGFITYAPQNPYRGKDRFRTIQRKSNPMKRSLYSYIIPQHERTLEWLSSLPNVDPKRIGFYGLSYGGKTAVRVPPMVKQYALSICSADFDEWVLKITTNEDRYSYIFTGEYEIFEWNMGHVANYAELSNLMTPRPFMVERGHDDGVAPDEWVAWEFAKVRRHYNQIGIGERTEIEFFDGPHTINGQGTYRFLHRHLNWPEPSGSDKAH